MKHLGDITKLKGSEVPIVDIVTGGSPCQDLSIAGRREGLDGERSGLFMEQIRLIKEMRDYDRRTNGRTGKSIRPRYMVWENVLGAFSSNGGKTSESFSKRRLRLPTVIPQFLDYRKERLGLMQVAFWETDGLSLGGYTPQSFGVSPRDAIESHLSQILEERPLPRYCLSEKACQGILRRAKERGKELPRILEEALIQSAFRSEQAKTGG